MATNGGRKASTSNSSRNKKTGRTNTQGKKTNSQQLEKESALYHEIGLIVLFVLLVILFFCNFGLIGTVGDAISGFMFGIFGLTAYIVPVLLFLAFAFWFANEGNPSAIRKLIAGIVLFLMIGVVCDMIGNASTELSPYNLKELYIYCRDTRKGGGVLSGSICYLLKHYLDTFGTILVVLLLSAISVILLTEKSLLAGVKRGSAHVRELSREDAERRREIYENKRLAEEEQKELKLEKRSKVEEMRLRREEERAQKEELRAQKKEARRLREEEIENERILRMDKKVSGVMMDTTLEREDVQSPRDDMHEITYSDSEDDIETASEVTDQDAFDLSFEKVSIRSMHQVNMDEDLDEDLKPAAEADFGLEQQSEMQKIRIHKEDVKEESKPEIKAESDQIHDATTVTQPERKVPKKYMFPPLSRLQKGVATTGDSSAELKETAYRLQETLKTFGVRVSITDISQGPSVTRYELQPEQGVKVSKIVGLADDIKLNLAATDIRIEAPIPGKAAIGIEVPNKENKPVALRDLLESKEFREFPSNIAFAVGKDIAGKVVVSDIAKMPHMLIAGATGSGKSVCINTLIMSILYKAHPDDVKLIMIDPKVVELSVYNGIPHLLIPVVTDPKKASAALHWGVSEMEDRYRKFADFNVRDLKGYNQKVEIMQENGEENAPEKMPQIVIIVDELADLMMVCPGEVEESICRLAQLARAAGIHLIIATQRPSVDVITGLIKANMPSRVAFSVSSGVDSRTILDMNGAEKLLGKGDMLFYPQGYTKPARIQGAFVSDKEVSDVVDFLKNQTLGNTYAEDVEEKIQHLGSGDGKLSSDEESSELDELFEKAGRVIIEQESASIGMLQRAFKKGFNRAARIMDQLSEYGVVGEPEGTKPRKILMGPEQFEALIEEIL